LLGQWTAVEQKLTLGHGAGDLKPSRCTRRRHARLNCRQPFAVSRVRDFDELQRPLKPRKTL
jgi:hypothetical protein